MSSSAPSPIPLIESRIYVIRGQKVLIDADLAALYQVLTKNLNLAVRRNRSRFPEDFMFQLTSEESESLRLQTATSNRGGRRYAPYAFTEQGIAMLSSVLTSERAIDVNIAIMRAFVRLRQLLATNEDLALRLDEMERQQLDQTMRLDQQDTQLEHVFSTIEQLITPPIEPTRRRIGFNTSRAGAVNEY